jgi:hypothetical protein
VCVCVCVRACVRVCVRACVCVCACVRLCDLIPPDPVVEEDSIFGSDGLDLGLPALHAILGVIDIEIPDETDVESLIFDGSSKAPAPGPEPYGYGTLDPNDAFPASGAPAVTEDGA